MREERKDRKEDGSEVGEEGEGSATWRLQIWWGSFHLWCLGAMPLRALAGYPRVRGAGWYHDKSCGLEDRCLRSHPRPASPTLGSWVSHVTSPAWSFYLQNAGLNWTTCKVLPYGSCAFMTRGHLSCGLAEPRTRGGDPLWFLSCYFVSWGSKKFCSPCGGDCPTLGAKEFWGWTS